MDTEPTFKKKSDNNLRAADLLINNELANESVHCSYYTVLQCCKYFLMERKNIDEQQLNAILKGASSHSTLKIEVRRELQANNAKLANDFRSKFEEIQEAREIADYENTYISDCEAKNYLGTAKHIINKYLNPHLNPQKK